MYQRRRYKSILLTPQEIERCKEFSRNAAPTQQDIEFGQADTAARKTAEIARDILIGKMAEVALARMLKEDFGVEVPLDFEVYDRGKWDDNDMVLHGWNIDIKSTRIGSWLLVEWNKLDFRQKQGELPHAFFMCKTDWDMEEDTPRGWVKLIGSISLPKLKEGEKKVHTLRKDEVIPGTKTHLQADNFGVRFEDLNSDWNVIIRHILDNDPPCLDDYPNPYTGETVPQYPKK